MSIKVAPKMISLEKLKILTHLQKLPKNVGDLGKIIVAKVVMGKSPPARGPARAEFNGPQPGPARANCLARHRHL